MVVRVVQTSAVSGARILSHIPLDVHGGNAKVQWSVNHSGNGTFTAAVEYTLDKIQDTDVSALWLSEAALTATSAATMDHPAAAIRLNISAASGNNIFGFRVLQTGNV